MPSHAIGQGKITGCAHLFILYQECSDMQQIQKQCAGVAISTILAYAVSWRCTLSRICAHVDAHTTKYRHNSSWQERGKHFQSRAAKHSCISAQTGFYPTSQEIQNWFPHEPGESLPRMHNQVYQMVRTWRHCNQWYGRGDEIITVISKRMWEPQSVRN